MPARKSAHCTKLTFVAGTLVPQNLIDAGLQDGI
jgi:hypothetical protein